MSNLKLVIAGAVYYDDKSDEILIPHFTGEYYAVDCTQYYTKEDILNNFSEEYFKEVEDDYKTYNGVKYYYAEYSPYNTEDLELLSDLSDLKHLDDESEFD